jgi:hypothetical protein
MKKMLFILGEELARSTNLQSTMCMGMMRLSIENLAGTSDPKALETFIGKMTFLQWKLLIEDPDLRKRLTNMGVKDPAGVLAQVRNTLIMNQALFTMAAI